MHAGSVGLVAAIVAAALAAPSAAGADAPVPDGHYTQPRAGDHVLVLVDDAGRAHASWPVRCSPGRATALSRAMRVAADGSFHGRVRRDRGPRDRYSVDVSGRFEQDGEWVAGRYRSKSSTRAGRRTQRCATPGWVRFRAQLTDPAYLPGTWEGTTGDGLSVGPMSLGEPRLTRWVFNARMACHAPQDQATGAPPREWTEDQALEFVLEDSLQHIPGAAVNEGRFAAQSTGTDVLLELFGRFTSPRQASGTYDVEQQPSADGTGKCRAEGSFNLSWQSRGR
jgi:hypothetical protein